MKATTACAQKLQQILALYEAQSGQMINKEKSSAFFSKGTRHRTKRAVLNVLGISRESQNQRYLGLPVHLGASKKKEFEYIKEKIWRRIQGWKEKLLSRAGKEILIKAVAQAIPTYAMSCFDLTKALCEEISTMICRYWWDQQEGQNKCHWLSWEKLSSNKSTGGLGFRDLHIFNLAMLARQSWRLLKCPDSLCATILKAKYFPQCSILEATPKQGMSYTWRSILKGCQLMKEGLVWRVGNGESIAIWNDPWIPRGTTRRPSTPRGQSILTTVSDLINPVTEQWDEDLLRDHFSVEDVQDILMIPIRPEMQDEIAWHYEKKGVLSVKSAYQLGVSLRDEGLSRNASSSSSTPSQSQTWKSIWNQKLPGRVLIFLWRFTHNSLPTKLNIKRKKVELDTRCPVCWRLDEDGGHIFLRCKAVKQVWRALDCEDLRLSLCECANARQVTDLILSLPLEKRSTVIILLWNWWTARNKANAGEKLLSADEVCSKVRKHLAEFCPKEEHVQEAQAVEDKWELPDANFIKVNVDAAFCQESRLGAWGFIARGNDGSFIAAGTGTMNHLSSALHAEASAFVAAIESMSNLGSFRVIFESDSLSLVNALKTGDADLSDIGVLFREARSLCVLAFDAFEFRFCRRSCNKVAHAIAQHGKTLGVQNLLWLDDEPDFVIGLVASDLATHQG
jgi:ribonuclease HI